jgi:hypothetical protein
MRDLYIQEAPGKRVVREKPDNNTRSLAALTRKSLTKFYPILASKCRRILERVARKG